jgi:hypothetical protein
MRSQPATLYVADRAIFPGLRLVEPIDGVLDDAQLMAWSTMHNS